MGKADSDKQDDADVLRAWDIVPPYNKKIHQEQDFQKTETDKREGASSQNQRKQPSEDITSPPAEKKAERPNDVPTEAADVEQRKRKIPRFDLAEQILAEQRKIAAMRRKAPPKVDPVRDSKDLGPRDKGSDAAGMLEAGVAGPGKKVKAPSRVSGVQSIRYTVQPPPALSEQEQIIAEIVARDIEQMCGCLDA